MSPRSGFCILLIAATLAASPSAGARRRRKSDLLDTIGQKIDSAFVKAPADEEVCFSPDEPCDVKLLKFIDSAQTSLDIAIYDINLDELVHHILAKARQIPVRMVVDRKQAKGEHSLVRTLIQGGVSLKYGHQRGIMHNKFVVVDGRMLELGSFNYTHHAAQANNENQLYLAKPAIVERYRRRFEKLWAEGDSR